MRILGAIIAGGQSRRMGGAEKALLELGGRPLLHGVIARLGPQVAALVINANGEPARFAAFGLDVVPDRLHAVGTPLAGLEAVMAFAAEQGFEAVVSLPSDTPFLPVDLVQRLKGDGAAIAQSSGQDHYLTGYWPVSLHAALRAAIEQHGLRALRDWVALCRARPVAWPAEPYDPFFNINTPHDLALARALAETLK